MDTPLPTSSAPRPDVESLLSESTRLRTLALRLLRGTSSDGDADDIVQSTWLAALQHLPADPAHRRPWLARVTTNFARHTRRSRTHRTAREHDCARTDHTPSTADTVERLEAQRVLVDALHDLDEPYRTTVLRRYFDNHTCADIARAESVPAATIRWRLMHALELLRTRLDAHYGDRGTWGLAFLPLTRIHPALTAGTAGATLTGVLLMNALARTALIAAVVLSGSLGVWLALRPAEPHLGSSGPAVAASTGLGDPAPSDERTAEDLAAVSVPDARSVPSATVPESTPGAPQASLAARVDGRFVDASGKAIALVRIVEPESNGGEPVVSDAQGAFVLEIPLPPTDGTMRFEARAAGWATFFGHVRPRPSETQHMGDIVLEAGGTVTGVVLDQDGGPLANAKVIATDPQLDDEVEHQRRLGPGSARVPHATTAADGSFRLEGVPAKLVRVWANSAGMRWSMSEPIQVPPVGVRSGLVLQLEPYSADDLIEGIVLDPDGKPLARMNVSYTCAVAGSSWSSGKITGDDGRFRILVTRKVPHDLYASDRAGRWPAVALAQVAPGKHDVVLRFIEPRRFELVVQDEHGAPVEAFGVSLREPEGHDEHWGAPEETHTGGRFAVPIPERAFVIEAYARGHEKITSAAFEPSAVPARYDMTLRTLPGVRGRVLANGKPVSGARVELHAENDERMRVEKDGWLTRINPNVDVWATTDVHGAFDLTVRKSGRYVIACAEPGFARAVTELFPVDPKVGVDDIEVVLARGGTIEGRVLVPPGRDAGGIIVGITRYDLAPRTRRTASDGSFRFEGLTPGAWSVQRAAAEIDPGSGGTSFGGGNGPILFPTDCVVVEGQVTRFDLDLRRTLDVVLVAHVSVDGAPAAGWSVIVWPDATLAHSGDLPGGTVDASGTVRIVLPRTGKVRAHLRPLLAEGSPVEITEVMEIAAGDNPWIVDLVTGAIEGRSAAGAGAELHYTWLDGEKLVSTARFQVDAQGRFRMPLVPRGKSELTLQRGVEPHVTREVLVEQGKTTVVDWP